MRTRPVTEGTSQSERTQAGSSGENLKKIQDDMVKQMSESAARFGQAMSKTMEIAEAGMTMSLSLLNTGGERLLNALASKIAGAAQTAPANGAYENREDASEAAASEPVIGNAIPVAPGDDVSISFSLSNDVPDCVKRVTVALDQLRGERTGHPLDRTALAVTPAEKEILPLDFEKFIIRGTVAADAPPDRYSGLIAVQGDERFTIRVCVAVEAKAGK